MYCVQAALGVAVLVAATAPGTRAQTPTEPVVPSGKVVALSGGACAAVAVSGKVSLDWNPGFDYESVVSAVDRFSLILTKVAADGNLPLRPYGPGTHALRSTSVTPLANGYYHMEFRVSRRFANGTFRVVDAAVAPRLMAGYEGPAPRMINSPANAPLCFSVDADPGRHD